MRRSDHLSFKRVEPCAAPPPANTPHGQGVGGGVYNLGTSLFEVVTVIAGNHASTSNDDGFGY